MTTRHCIINESDKTVIARASDDQVISLEGNWYFHPDTIDKNCFDISDRLYNCPKKGICQWVDMKVGRHYWNDIGWVYPKPLKAFKNIAGWYGFYDIHKYYHHELCDQK